MSAGDIEGLMAVCDNLVTVRDQVLKAAAGDRTQVAADLGGLHLVTATLNQHEGSIPTRLHEVLGATYFKAK